MSSSLNRIFKVIWSKVQMAWVAVSEATTAHGKQQSITRITRTITTVAMLSGGAAIAAPPAPNQLPTGGQVAAGVAAIGTNGNTMTVTQSSNRAAINWNTFDIGSQAQVNFVQPSANAVALNRVNSGNPSQIFGQLSSNGQIYLINAAGVYFAPGAQVNVGGIVATTMQMSDAAFMAGSTTFERNGSTGKVINEGTITTSLNGYIAMLAPEVRNSGLLLAQSGTVAMGAGERITLNFGPTSKLDSITVTAADIDTLVENRYAIKAPNGLVILSARAANQLAASVVNSGTIEAKGVSQQGGRILLEGSTVSNTGTLDVSSDTAQAGTIQINGKNVSISGNVVATTPANAQGGSIKISATQSLNVANANLNAGANNGTGGQIELSAHQLQISDSNLNADGDLQGGTVQISATASQPNNPFHDPLNIPTLPASLAATGFTSISSRGRRGQGGNATLTGDNITLDGNTAINVSGATGGGNALIGGDWQGTNGTYQATTVYMGQNVTIDASATDIGNGGKVVLWSDITNQNSWTQVDGTIKATGANGTGGQVETSGHYLGLGRNVLVKTGDGGEWLLDPADITISCGTYAMGASIVNGAYTWSPGPSSTGSTLDADTLASNLQNNANVVVITNAGTGNGNITVSSDIWAQYGHGNLTLNATGIVSINATIALCASLNVYGANVNINGNITTIGDVYIKSQNHIDQAVTSTTTTNGGNVIYWADVVGTSSNYNDGYIRSGNIVTNGGNVWMGGNAQSSSSAIWKGMSVGSGYAYSTSYDGIALRGNIDTRVSGNTAQGGSVWLAGYSSASVDISAEANSRNITVGSGDIALVPYSMNMQGAYTLNVNTTGQISVAPISGQDWWSGRNYTFSGSLSSNTFTGSNQMAGVVINNFSNIGGINLGTYNGSVVAGDTAYVSANARTMTISSAINISGPINVFGGTINDNNSLTTTANGASILLKSSGNIVQAASANISTNGGNVTLWSNSGGTSGYIRLSAGADISTSGGNIILGGGADIASSFAVGNIDVLVGILLERNVLNSGGGNIILRGQSADYGNAWYDIGVQIANSNLIAGSGKVSLTGVGLGSGSANVQGIWVSNSTISSANTAADAISLLGDTSNVTSAATSLAINIKEGTNSFQATGIGGGILINGSSGGTGTTYEHGVDLGNISLFSASGPITVISSNANSGASSNYANLYLGGNTTFGTNNATASTANITLRADAMTIVGTNNNISTAGTLTIESLSDSFVNALSFPVANLTLGSGISGLTLGKSTNTANITIGSATSIAGPITVYAGNIAINAGLTTTASGGNILLKAANAISTAAGLTLQTNNGSLVFWSNSNGAIAGGVAFGNNVTLNTANGSTSQDSGGGDIVMGGGSDVGSTPTGYATSNASAGVKIGADSNGTTTIRSGGGNVTILGCSSSTTGVAAWGQLDLNSGQGAININGSTSSVSGYGVAIGGANTNIQSAKTSGTAINITGVSTSMYGVSGSSASTSKYIVATGGGDIVVNGTGGTAGIYSDGIAYLASGGSITLNGSGTNAGIWFQNTISTLGQMSGSAVPSSAANIKLNADVITRDVAPGFFTSGNVTIQSISDSFSSAFSTTNFTFGNALGRLGGLTIGKATNTQNVTISNDTNISGAIAVYGGNISVNGNLTTTNATTGDINLYAANGASVGSVTGSNDISLADNRTLTISQNGSSTYSGVISGNGSSLVKGGSGALTLSGANTYNGTTNITAGTLIVSGSLSDSTVVNVSADANYNLSASDTIGSFAGLGTINLGSYNLTTASNSSTVFDGVLAGNGNLSKGGTGSLTLNGTNTYSGITTVSCGTLALASDASLGAAPGTVTAGRLVLNGGTLQATANFTLNANRGISLGASNGTFSVDPSITLNYAGIIAGTGSMTKSGNGTLVLSGTNTYSGNTTISAGSLIVDGSGSLASGNYAGNISNNGELAFNTSTAQTLSGIISGTGNLTQNGSGTVFLSGNNTYTGNTTISDGTLQLDSGGTINNSVGIINNGNLTYNNSLVNTAALVSGTGNISVGTASSTGTTLQLTSTLGVTGDLSVYNGNVLDLNGYSSPNAISIAGTGISSGGALINSNATAATQSGAVTLTGDASLGGSGNLTISGNIGGAYALTKIGAGSTTLSGANTYSGNTTISGGTLSVSSDANLGTAPGSATTNSLVLNGGTLEATANFTLDANRGISLGTSNGTFSIDPSVSLNYAGIMAGTGNMTKSGSGTLVLGGANTYNGTTTISAGTLIVNGSGSLGSGSYASNISNSGNLTFNTTTAQALSGIISGAGNLTQNGVGTLTLTGTNTYGGTTTIGSGANLQLGNNGTTGSIDSTSSLVDNGTLTFNRSNAVTYGVVISGAGGLIKAGSGTLSLTAANTYSGSTNVTAGTLQMGSGSTAGSVNGSSAVNISSGASFVVNRSDNVTLANAISGPGNLSTVGSNVTTLTGTATYSGTTNVTNGGIVFTNNATPSTSGFIGNGTVTIQPNGSAFSSARTLSYTYASTLTGLTVGNATSTSNADLTIGSAINISGPISLYGGNITLSSGLATNNSANGNVLLKAASNISQTVSVETNGSSVIYWVDSDGNGIGTISVNGTSSSALANITTNGGDIWMGGGSGSTTWNGITVGNASATTTTANTNAINIVNASLMAAEGNISLSGLSNSSSGTGYNYGVSVRTNTNISTTSGSINIAGSVSGSYAAGTGVTIGDLNNTSGNTTITTTTGSISLTGTAQNTSNSGYRHALLLYTGANAGLNISTSSGDITLSGTNNSTGSDSSGVQIMSTRAATNNLNVVSRTGNISIYGIAANASTNQNNNGFRITANNTINNIRIGYDGTNDYSGDILIQSDSILQQNIQPGNGSISVQSTGNLTIQSNGSSFTYLRAGTNGALTFDDDWNFGTSLASFTLGKSTNTLNVSLSNALEVAGPIQLYGGNISLNGTLTTTSSGIIKLKANSGNITQNATGVLTTDGLALLGGNATLTAASNNVTTLAAQNIGSMSFKNAGNLTIGSVNPTGVNATGPVNITVQSGNIDLTEAIITTSNATNAIVLNAGAGSAVGNVSGGNILVSGNGSVSVGTGGRATLYTGSVADSAGVTDLVGSGSGNFRYNSNATTNNFNTTAAPLGDGVYAIYREQPTLTLSTANASIVYGNSTSTAISSTAVNGDTLAQIFGSSSVPTVTVSGNTSTAGYYTAGNHTANISGPNATILGYAAPTYSNGTIEITKASLTVTGTVVANTTYSNSTAATFSNDGSLVGVLTNGSTSDEVNLTAAGNFSSKNVGTNLTVTMTDSISGADADNYVLTQPTGLTGNITQADLTITANGASTQYGLGTNLTAVGYTTSGLVSGETIGSVDLASNGSANTTNVGSYNITAANATGGTFISSNYNISYANGTLTVTPANITVTADNQTRPYGALNPTTGNITVSGTLYNGDTMSSTANVSSTATSTTAAGQTANLTPSAANFTNGSSDNYNISYVNGTLTITQADLTITANSTNTQYGLGTNLTAVGYTTSGLANSETIGSVALSSSGTANTSSVGSYNITAANATGGTFTASNYNISYTNGTLTVTPANITVTADNQTRLYGALNPTTGNITVSGTLYNGDTMSSTANVSSTATSTTAAGQTANLTPSAANFTNGSSDNYNISYVNGTLTVTQANLTITANNVSTQYGLGTTLGTTAFTSSGLANSETIGSVVLASSGTANTTNVGSYNITASGASGGNFTASNYNISYANGSLTVTPANITVTADNQTRPYGALNPTTGNITVSGTLYNGDTMSSTANVSSTATNTTAAGQTANLTPSAATFTNGLAGNYNIHYTNGTLTVNPAPLGVVATGVYNGTTTLTPTSYALTGLANGETVTSVSVVSLSNANVAANTYITGLTSGGGTANLSNYQISQAYNDSPNTTTTNAFTMAKANLTVTADNAANFIGQGLPGSYNVSYTGFVAGQNASNAGLSAGTVSNSANGSSGAGTYTLTPSGFSASNYSIAYTNGTYTIVPADTLLVQTGSLSTTYGTSATLTPTSVQYYVNGTGVVNLNYVNNSGSTYTYNDGYGGTVTFTLSPSNAAYSTSNNLKAATYQISGSNLTQTGVNLNGSGVYVGSLTINQQALTASTSDVSKVYDGTTAMSGLNVGLSPVVSGDVVTTAGTGAFSQANAGTNLSYNVSGLSLGGADAGNYYLTGGTSFSGSNGVITPRTVTLSADQVYSGSTALTNVTIGNLVGNQTLTYTGNASSKNVADNGSNYIANLLLGNGTDGGLSDNYQLPTLNLTNAPVTITRLNSVTWTGGASGNWFDPANWAGGAVPDLNNVANVILPAGVTVFFNNTVVPPAQAGTVSVDSITGASANLSQSAGNLSVGLGGITLYTLNQSNGTLTSLGPINLTNYIQSGGNLTANSNFTTISFDQNGGATIILGALDTTSYNQSNGTTSVTGNLSTGNMTLTGGTTNALSNLVVTNTLDQQAGNLSITGNTTAGNISLSGGNLTANGSVTTGNLSQTNGTLTANSSVTVNGTYSLSGGNATVAGSLSANTLSQSGGAITVNGNATTQTYNQSGGSATILGALDATNYTKSNGTTSVTGNLSTGNMTLTGGNATTLANLSVNGSYNQTGGQVNVTGNAIITTTGTMTLGNLTVGGALHANSTSGSINQTSGTQMSVTGRASFYAPNGIISLNSGNSFPGGSSIIDRNGDRNKPVSSGTDWVFQQIMVQGGTMVYLPLPKTQVGQSKRSHRAMAFTGEVILLADEGPENSTDPGYMAQPYTGFTDRNFGTAPIITLIPETEGGKVVQHGDRLFIVNTDSLGSPNVRRTEDDLDLPKPSLQLSGPDEVPPVKVEQISRIFP